MATKLTVFPDPILDRQIQELVDAANYGDSAGMMVEDEQGGDSKRLKLKYRIVNKGTADEYILPVFEEPAV